MGGGAVFVLAKHCRWRREPPAQHPEKSEKPEKPAPKAVARQGGTVRRHRARDKPSPQSPQRTLSNSELSAKASKRSHASLSSIHHSEASDVGALVSETI